MDAISFTVDGQPVAQPRPRISTIGGRGRGYTPAAHPIHAYRQAIVLMARRAATDAGHTVTAEPVVLEVVAVFGRPPSHLTKSGEPRASAPAFPPRNDVTNVVKGLEDAITNSGAVWLDDDQVVGVIAWKRYGGPGDPPRTVITIRGLDHGEA